MVEAVYVNCSVSWLAILTCVDQVNDAVGIVVSTAFFTNYCVCEVNFCCDPLLVPDFTLFNHIIYGLHPSSRDINRNTAFLFRRTCLLER